MNTKLVYFGIILMILVLASFSVPYVWSADAQRSTQVLVRELESQGKENCEVWNINDYFYLPIRFNFSFEPTLDVDPDISSRGAESEGVFYEGTSETFSVVTNTAGIHTVGFVLDYEVKHKEPRQVYYQVYSQDNTLMMEGNWVHEGFTFCKYIVFQTTEAPHILTPEEIQEANNKFNSDFRKEVATYNTTVENSLLGIVVTSIFGGIVLVGILAFMYMQFRSMGKIANKPVKKLDEMIVIYRQMIDTLRLTSEDLLSSKNETVTKITNMVSAIITDLPLIIQGKRDAIQVKESFVSPETLIKPNSAEIYKLAERKEIEENKELSMAILTDKEREEVEKAEQEYKEQQAKEADEAEQLQKEEYGLETKVPEELPPQPEGEPKFNVKKNGDEVVEKLEKPEPKPEPEPEPEPVEKSFETEETVQVPADAKCSQCKKDPEIICQKCDQLFCEKHHKKHKCKGKPKPEPKEEPKKDEKKNILSKLTESAKKPVETVTNLIDSEKDEKEVNPYDIEYITEALEDKKPIKELDEEIIQSLLKKPHVEVREMYDGWVEEYKKNPTDAMRIRNNACLKRLVRSAK